MAVDDIVFNPGGEQELMLEIPSALNAPVDIVSDVEAKQVMEIPVTDSWAA